MGQGVAQVDVVSARGRVTRGGGRSVLRDRDLEHPTPTPTPCQLSGLVDGDRDEPRSQPLGVADRVHLSPGDRPGRLDGLLGEFGVTARDHETDAAHVGVIGVHDAREGDLVAARGRRITPAEVSVPLLVMVTIAR